MILSTKCYIKNHSADFNYRSCDIHVPIIGAITGVPETSNDCLCSMAVVPEDGTILGEASSILFKN